MMKKATGYGVSGLREAVELLAETITRLIPLAPTSHPPRLVGPLPPPAPSPRVKGGTKISAHKSNRGGGLGRASRRGRGRGR